MTPAEQKLQAFNMKKRLIWKAIEADPALSTNKLAVAHGVSTKTVLRLMVTHWKRRALGTEENSNG